MALIVVRLLPVEPVDGVKFERYLRGLTVQAFDLGTNDLAGVTPIGEAAYLPPPDLNNPGDPDPDTGVVQQVAFAWAVATAVIEIPANGHPEHGSSDLRLEITRGGGTVVHNQVYFNVAVVSDPLPAPGSFSVLPPSLYLALPAPERDRSTEDAFVTLPTDGTPPRHERRQEGLAVITLTRWNPARRGQVV